MARPTTSTTRRRTRLTRKEWMIRIVAIMVVVAMLASVLLSFL